MSIAVSEQWPQDGLENVPNCPVCGTRERAVLHEKLSDKIFGCARGQWTLYRCSDCRAAYLDPRPNRETIGLAYERYYTHIDRDDARAQANVGSRLGAAARACINGYRNRCYGTHIDNASAIGSALISAMPPIARYFDANARHLARPSKGADRLLDVGSGNGEFLNFANDAGWNVTGLDLDDKAVEVSRKSGLDVHHGTLDLFANQSMEYDLITVAHVIEHVHDPKKLISDCFRLLKPGGKLWLETPNIDALGHQRFGRNWRGLEPPRHLVILSQDSLSKALTNVGFTDIHYFNRGLNTVFTYAESELIARGKRIDAAHIAPTLAPRYWLDAGREYISSHLREFLTVSARRPADSNRQQ